MSEAEIILARLESNRRSYRSAFCFAMVGLTVIVIANRSGGVADVIQTKQMLVNDGVKTIGTFGTYEHKIVFGTTDGTQSMVSLGEGPVGTGVVALGSEKGKNLVRLSATKAGSGCISVYEVNGAEIANASPNITDSGSLFIQSSSGALVGEINGDKLNGGALITHDSKGAETGRVHN